jgi:hypothetical protein
MVPSTWSVSSLGAPVRSARLARSAALTGLRPAERLGGGRPLRRATA